MESHPPDAPRTRSRGRLFLVLGIGLLAAAMVVSALPSSATLDPTPVQDETTDPKLRLSALVEQVRSPDADIRNAGVAGLAGSWMLSREFPGIVPENAVARCLEDENEGTRKNAAIALAYMPTLSPANTERLVEMLFNDPDPRVRGACAAAVAWAGSDLGEATVGRILGYLGDIVELPPHAGSGLGPAGNGPLQLVEYLGMAAMPSLMKLVEDGSPTQRALAWRCLDRLAFNDERHRENAPEQLQGPLVKMVIRRIALEPEDRVRWEMSKALDHAGRGVSGGFLKSLQLPEAYRRVCAEGCVMDEATGTLLRWALHSDAGLWSEVERLAASEVAAERLAAVKAAESPAIDNAVALNILGKLAGDSNERVSRAADRARSRRQSEGEESR